MPNGIISLIIVAVVILVSAVAVAAAYAIARIIDKKYYTGGK